MAQQWYYAQGSRKTGPITPKQLRELAACGTLRPTDLVWTDGNDQGREARLVKGLFASVEAGASPPGAGSTVGTSRPSRRVDPSLDLDRLRDRLTRHAGVVPHHGIDDLGSAIEVRGARRIPVHRIAWTSLFERRQVVERQAPHDGSRAFPPPKYRRQNLDAWTLTLPSPGDFADGSSELPVEGSEAVQGCGQCRAVGHVTCDGCQGQKAVACGQCAGGGLVRCGTCSGTGRTYQARSEQRARACSLAGRLPALDGSGTCRGGRDDKGRACPRCNGTGTEYYIHQERHPVPCVTCSGQGQHACRVCGGSRVVACPKCGGHGQLTCTTCQGHKRVVQFLAVVRSHETREEVAVIPAHDCPEGAVQGLDPGAEFRETLRRSTFGPPLDLSLGSKLHVLDDPIRSLRDKLQAQVGDGLRRAGDRLVISEAEVIQLAYSFDGKEYTAWFTGENGPVHAPESPITEAAARHVEDALSAWKEGRQEDAIRALRPAVAMAKKSPECRAVLESWTPRIPEELMRRASAFSLTSWVVNLVQKVRRGWSFEHPPRKADKPSSTDDDFPAPRRPWERVWVILPLVVFCFPVGLPLIWLNRSWSHRTKTYWMAGGAAFFGLVLLSPEREQKAGTSQAGQQATSSTIPEEADFTTTGQALVQEFEAGEEAADRKYRGKTIRVSFSRLDGSPHPDADFSLAIRGGVRPDGSVQLDVLGLFDGEEGKKARNIDYDRPPFSLVGRYAGIVGSDIRLVGCRVGSDTKLRTSTGGPGAAKQIRTEWTKQANGVVRQMEKYYLDDGGDRVLHGPTFVYRRDGTVSWIIMYRDGRETGRRQFDELENPIREIGDMTNPIH